MIDLSGFIHKGTTELEPFIANVKEFVDTLGSDGKLEKTPLRAKPPDDYIRNILAVGVLSHINRGAFLETKRRIIVLPDCLKNYSGIECCKEDLGNATVCTQCNADCLVFEAMERFEGASTDIVLEPEDFKSYFKSEIDNSLSLGIVGVACALTLLSGFHYTLKHGIPTQGVFLNYASCEHHWSHPGINTSFSYERLAWVMGKDSTGEPEMTKDEGATYNLDKSPLSPSEFYRRLDLLAKTFETDYLPQFKNQLPEASLSELSIEISKAIVPNLISRDSA
ncbi:MAG: DUF116 domain-containing protein [candidate division Zixibacteria bacterium]|nr:DUF116 domain-containing protein [candidate division Zixibacteria bacterium]